MLRLTLDWAHRHAGEGHRLAFRPDARWYSEALLPSAFLARRQGDKLAENWTHADGLIGHFNIGGTSKEGLTLRERATQLVVVEAKMWSKLSRGTANAPDYDQAARTVACIAEVLKRANIDPREMECLAFLVVAPLEQIDKGVFDNDVTEARVRERVRNRVDEYRGARDEWFDQWFIPTLNAIDIDLVSWEELLERLESSYRSFYEQCLRHNKPIRRTGPSNGRSDKTDAHPGGSRAFGSSRSGLVRYRRLEHPDQYELVTTVDETVLGRVTRIWKTGPQGGSSSEFVFTWSENRVDQVNEQVITRPYMREIVASAEAVLLDDSK